MWIFLWVVLSVFVLGTFAWSLQILLQQKRAWQAYAKKTGLAYQGGSFMASPSLSGAVDGHRVALYSAAQGSSDLRGERYVTVIELEMGSGTSAAGIIADKEMAAFVARLSFKENFTPDHPKWDKSRVIRTHDPVRLAAYLTRDRLDTLDALMSIKGAMALYFFDEIEGVLRIETSDPLRDAGKLDRIMKRFIAAMEKLRATEQELSAAGKAPASGT